MLDSLIQLDQQLLLFLNGFNTPLLDDFFWIITKTPTWIPFYAAIVVVIMRRETYKFKHYNIQIFALLAACIGLVILLADQTASGFAKPFFERFRPSHEPALEGLVTLYTKKDGSVYHGGTFGFFSSHACNSFAIAAFVIGVLKNQRALWVMMVWAFFFSYSRIYLGVHYPGDIIVGALVGSLYGWLVSILFTKVKSKYWSQPQLRS